MANIINLNTPQEPYEDLPRTSFPAAEDSFTLMKDVNAVLMPLVNQYNTYASQGNITACNQLLASNPDLMDCFFNADKWNQIRDAILAMERYYLQDVQAFIYQVAQNTVGINDEPTEEQLITTTYSSGKINELLLAIQNDLDQAIEELTEKLTEEKTSTDQAFALRDRLLEVTLPAANWTNTIPYEQTVSVAELKSDECPWLVSLLQDGATLEEQKAYVKAYGIISSGVGITTDGAVTFKVYKKPAIDIKVGLKGV